MRIANLCRVQNPLVRFWILLIPYPGSVSNQRLYHLLVTRREYKLVKRSLTLALAVFFRLHIDNICKIEGC